MHETESPAPPTTAQLLRENRELRGALEAALPVLQDYASSNPMHFYRGAWHDPRGVHAAVKLVTVALGMRYGLPPCFACNGTGRDLGVDHAPGVAPSREGQQ